MLVNESMDDAQRERLVGNIVGHVSKVTTAELRARVIQYWTNVDAWLGAAVAAGLPPLAGSAPVAEATPGPTRDAEEVSVAAH